MATIKAESGIPMPEAKAHKFKPKYPWKTMAIGDSFQVDLSLSCASSTASRASKAYSRKFRAAELDGRVRIWRTA